MVAIARSWSLDDLAAGMDGDNETGEVSSGLAQDRRCFFFLFLVLSIHVHLDNVTCKYAIETNLMSHKHAYFRPVRGPA